jgi:hypothetical protein
VCVRPIREKERKREKEQGLATKVRKTIVCFCDGEKDLLFSKVIIYNQLGLCQQASLF